MALMECSGCGRAVDSRSMTSCPGCHEALCPECARENGGYCAECAGEAQLVK